jgi:CheY-like chemotaxis protein
MRKVLLIVDDWEALEWYEDQLSSEFEVTCAPFGSEGIRLAKELQPDKIFMDLILEDMSPGEGIEELQSDPKTQRIPLTFIQNKESDLNFECPPGATYLTRPFHLSCLIELLNS